MKVLLVEDEEFIRDLFKRQLDLSGFTTDAFANGQDGLAAISKNAYDLVLLDIMLPDINGLQILQNIRQNPTTKNVAVVLLTNLGQDAVIKQGFELGADGYLVKAAYTPDQIVQEVKNIMQKKSAQARPPVAGQPVQNPSAPMPTPLAGGSAPAAPAFPGQAPVPQIPNFPTNQQPPAAPEQDPLATVPVPPIPPPSASEIVTQATSPTHNDPLTPTTEKNPSNS